MERSSTEIRAVFLVLIACTLAAVISPWLVWSPNPPTPNTPEIVRTLQNEAEEVEPWVKLYDAAMELQSQLCTHSPDPMNQQIANFNEKSIAQREFREWLNQHRPLTLDEVKADDRGSEVWQRYRNALIQSCVANHKEKAVDEAKSDLVDLIRQSRAGMVGRPPEKVSVSDIEARLQEVRQSVQDESQFTHECEQDASDEVASEFQRLRRSP